MANTKHNAIKQAETWASSLWSKAHSRWISRTGQDRNYRTSVLNPAIVSEVRGLFPEGGIHLLDLGCGDGFFLDDGVVKEMLAGDSSYIGVDISKDFIKKALTIYDPGKTDFIEDDITDPAFPDRLLLTDLFWNFVLSVMTVQEIADVSSYVENIAKIVENHQRVLIITVHPDFALWLRDNGRMEIEDDLSLPTDDSGSKTDKPLWHWAGLYPIVDEPNETFCLPYFHRTVKDYMQVFTHAGFSVDEVIELPGSKQELAVLVHDNISPFSGFDSNLYWPRIGETASSVAFVLQRKGTKKEKKVKKKSASVNVLPFNPGEHSYPELRNRFLDMFSDYSGPVETREFSTPDRYNQDRVTYIIPPITHVDQRSEWKPGDIYIVKSGVVAIGRVFYTKTSGEFLIEELILRKGDIFGEFEVPLSILGSPALWGTKLPPRFNMTYGAWASGKALNWAMAYPRYIPRERIDPGNPVIAVHPFYIKSKDIRPKTEAEIYTIPIDHFEQMVAVNPDAMTWFLMNVLWKNRLYFEPPAQGYGRSPEDIIARLLIRILAYRIRLGIVLHGTDGNRTTCRTFIGPAEWLKHGIGSFAADLMDVVRSIGGSPRETLRLPVFTDELADKIEVTYHFPVKDLDDDMLRAMGCSPEEDRAENRYGLLTGIRIDLKDLDFFKNYLLERGE